MIKFKIDFILILFLNFLNKADVIRLLSLTVINHYLVCSFFLTHQCLRLQSCHRQPIASCHHLSFDWLDLQLSQRLHELLPYAVPFTQVYRIVRSLLQSITTWVRQSFSHQLSIVWFFVSYSHFVTTWPMSPCWL